MNHEVNIPRDKGFTIIELVIAMTLISFLLLGIAMTIVQVANIYNHGMIAKDVNQTSRTMSEELTSVLRTSSTFSVDASAQRYVTQEWGGRLCVGQYSYVWNYGKALAASNQNLNTFKDSPVPIKFVKVPDASSAYCKPNDSGGYDQIKKDGAVELLKAGDHSLALHAFKVTTNASAKDSLSNQQLYRFTYTIGTSDLTALKDSQSRCKLPGESGADPNYCSVEQFTLVLRVVGEVN